MNDGSYSVDTAALRAYANGPVEQHTAALRQGASSMNQAAATRAELPEPLSGLQSQIDSAIDQLNEALSQLIGGVEAHQAKTDQSAASYDAAEQHNSGVAAKSTEV